MEGFLPPTLRSLGLLLRSIAGRPHPSRRARTTAVCGTSPVDARPQDEGGKALLTMRRNDRAPTFEDTKLQFRASWDKWLTWAKLEEITELEPGAAKSVES